MNFLPTDPVLDCESFYDKKNGVSITQQGLQNYAQASDAYIWSIVTRDLKFRWCGRTRDLPNVDLPFDLETAQPWAFNSNFDEEFWNKNFPRFKKRWGCISDLSVHHQYPRDLARAAQAVTGVRVDKSTRDEMDGVVFDSLPEEAQQKVIAYGLNDSVVEAGLLNALEPMTDFEWRVAMHTRMINRRGVAVNQELLERDIQRLEEEKHRAFLDIPWSQLPGSKKGTLQAPLSMASLHRWCLVNGIPAPESRAKDSQELDDLMSSHPRLQRVIEDMRRFGKASTLLEKARTFQGFITDDGLYLPDLLYCGAPHTRRWSSKGFNIQNLDQFPIMFNDDEKNALAAAKAEHGDECWRHLPATAQGVWTRRWLVPRPGKVFLILDYSQIEPRCLAWLVGDEPFLDGIRRGLNPYEAHARATMGWTGGTLKKENPNRYKLSKIRVLQLGYGSGAMKFVLGAKREGLYEVFEAQAKLIIERDRPVNQKTNEPLTLEEVILGIAAVNVKDYRRDNPLITGQWSFFDQMIEAAMREEGDHNLEIQMPTGEILKHWYIRPQFEIVETELANGTTAKEKKRVGWTSMKTKNDRSSMIYRLWGGLLTENVTQRMARDVLADAVLRLEDDGLPVCWHAHDEVILEVDRDNAKDALAHATDLMRKTPAWCPGLPLDVGGGIFEHYVK